MTMTLKRLLLSTALTLPAFAGPAMAQDTGQPCQDLESMLENGLPQDAAMSEQELRDVLERGEPEVCAETLAQVDTDKAMSTDNAQADAEAEAQVAERDRTTVQIDEERVVEGVVRLDRTAPKVDVEQPPAEVTVEGGTPEIDVEQGRPEIVVRQKQATVKLEMAQPTITIDQPAPEIIVTMPDPSVSVSDAEPKVEVKQAEPTISVSQAPPQVNLDLRVVDNADASGDGVQVEDSQSGTTYAQGETQELQPLDNAEVTVNSGEPKVTYRETAEAGATDGGSDAASGKSRVNVQKAEAPKVTYESAEPKIDFTMTGEPKVEFTQSGEPKVTMQTAGQTSDAAQQNLTDQANAGEPSAETGQQTQQADAEATATATEDGSAATAEASDSAATATEEQKSAEADAATAPADDKAKTEQTASASAGPDIQIEGFQPVPVEEVSNDKLTSTALYNRENERIGDIEEVVSGDSQGVERIVVGVGGFLGIGERQVALDLEELLIMRETEGEQVRVFTDMTRDELENMERYDG